VAMFSQETGKVRLALILALLTCAAGRISGQEVKSFENDIPFGLRMCFFRGPADSTHCLITFAVENQNLLFYRRDNRFEASYEAFLSMREAENRQMVRGIWDKKVRVPSYDETNLEAQFEPLEQQLNVMPGKYEGFVELKDMQAVSYGNGRVSVNIPDFSRHLPKISTPLFFDPGKAGAENLSLIPVEQAVKHTASLKYPAGKPIFLLVEVYADSTRPPKGWKLTAEVVQALMVFPRVELQLEDGVFQQRKVMQIPTQTMGLGTYEIEVALRDSRNTSLARANTFSFRITKSADWIDDNYMEEVRYLKYLASEKEMKELMAVPKERRQAELKVFWDKLDPVPATAVNELKVQYFERIDYANKNFTSEEREGWETNMGEVYILLGPPTEIYGSRLNQIWVFERENLVLYFFNFNLRNRDEFDRYVRDRRWWRN
jgi:GWxTD domain-containing protein